MEIVAAKIECDGLKGVGIIIGRYICACYEVLLVVCSNKTAHAEAK